MAADMQNRLMGCLSPDENVRRESEAWLKSAEQSDLGGFMYALTQALSTEGSDLTVRQQSGLYLKNILYAKDTNTLEQNRQRWKALSPDAKTHIKQLILTVLNSPEQVARHTASQAIAEMGAIDLPGNQWPELLPNLLNNVTGSTPDTTKVSTLECLGYTCERLDYTDLDQTTTNNILTAIVDGMRAERSDPIRLAACTALRNSLLFCRGNMENKPERDMIMQVICEATQCTDGKVRAVAYECIVQIGEHYYDKLDDYMQVLAQLTFNSIKTEEEQVATQAIEFWSTLCDEEMDILEEIEECREAGEQPSRACKGYVTAALAQLSPLLLEALTKQDEDADLDDNIWNAAMASSTCLTLVASTVGDGVVDAVMPFVLQNIKGENWRFREASTMAFCCILEGPGTGKIGNFVNQSIPVLIQALKDPHSMVKDTTAWTLGRICELHASCVPPNLFNDLVTGLKSVLINESPRVSAQACFAIHNLAMQITVDDSTTTNLLSQYLPALLQDLLQVTERPDWDEANLRPSAYEAINMLIQHAAADMAPILEQLLPVIMDRLAKSFAMSVLTNEEKDAKAGLQGLLCGILQVMCQNLSIEAVQKQADNVMQILLEVFKTKNAAAHEEALMAAGALADKVELGFERYMDAFHPVVMHGLKSHEAYQVCTVAVGVVGDLTRALGKNVARFCNEIVQSLLEILQNSTLNRAVKPHVLSCFGDIALALEGGFEPYLQVTLMMLLQASQTRAPDDDEDLIDFVNTLREGILEAYTGIIQGLDDGGKVQLILPYCEAIMSFLETVTHDPNKDDEVISGAIGVLGDLSDSLGTQVPGLTSKKFVDQLLMEGASTGVDKIVELAQTYRTRIDNHKRGAGM
ncbi:hypothetical protein TrVE_jg11769 [Triparma verrucosa]|uniref:Importin N-terminal domain-containing protein n=1 Tax=Triparma verrucosa TaxID=1606542 RepID=A0A9W7C4Y1_9STRA|nr:hypothetical protein TrVE_jg11769 [Triparma verrucosa]